MIASKEMEEEISESLNTGAILILISLYIQ